MVIYVFVIVVDVVIVTKIYRFKWHLHENAVGAAYTVTALNIIKQASTGCEAQLPWKCLIMPTFWWAILTLKLV